MKSDFNDKEKAWIAEAEAKDAEAAELKKRAFASRDAREINRPLLKRLTFSAGARCECGLGMAYDPAGIVRSDKGPFIYPSQWECSGVLLGTADVAAMHTSPLSFTAYEIKSENQPSANGRSTRPKN